MTVVFDEHGEYSHNVYSIEHLVVTDQGYGCELAAPPTLSFVDTSGICTTLPEAAILCVRGNDDTGDFSAAHHYRLYRSQGTFYERETADDSTYSIIENTNDNFEEALIEFGPFVLEDSVENLRSDLQCEYADQQVCPWTAKARLDKFYFFRTGPSAEKLLFVNEDDEEDVLTMGSSSIYLEYTHVGAESNSGDNYDSVTFLLEYRGPGELYGLPSFCIDPDSGESTTTCVPEESEGGKLMRELNIYSVHFDNELFLMQGRWKRVM